MPVLNPEYDPDWEDKYAQHNAEREHLQESITAKIRADQFDAEFDRLRAQSKVHNEACLHTFISRHETVQGYAEWLFKTHPPDMGVIENVPLVKPDFETFESIDAVAKTWREMMEEAERGSAEIRKKLPTGQPENMKAFAGKQGEGVFSYWREMHQINTLVTVDQIQKDGIHVCLMYDPDANGRSIINGVEDVATTIYSEAKEVEARKKQEAASKMSLGERLKAMFGSKSENKDLTPQSFRFYTHIPPGTYAQENFSEVTMTFAKGRFHSPSWKEMDKVPASIQTARYDVMGRPRAALLHGHLRLESFE